MDQPESQLRLAQELIGPPTSSDHSLGDPAAAVTLLEYGDYECPGCLNAQPIVAALREELGETLRVIFRHFPQSSVHPNASSAALAAEAASNQKKFWPMHEALFKHQQQLAELDLTHLALTIGLEIYHFERDLESPDSITRVRSHHASGVRSGVKGTPTFFVNGMRYRGKHALADLLAAIRAARRD